MTDQIPAAEVRKIIASYRDGASNRGGEILAALKALVPAPPTLADMTEEERRACQWMQADVKGYEFTAGIIAKINQTDAHLIASDGETWFLALDTVTPRPDLPLMEWPGDQKPAPAPALPDGWRLADHKDHGRVMVTTRTPNHDGNVYFVLPICRNLMGFDWRACKPAELTYLDQEDDTPTGPNIPAVGTVIESADDPRIAALPVGSILLDRNEEATTKRPREWTGTGFDPIAYERDKFGPWTVLHITKEADQ